MVQNMSTFVCPHCNQSTAIFGSSDKLTIEAKKAELQIIGDVPLHRSICDDADRGMPTVVSEPDSTRAKTFMDLAQRVATLLRL